MWKFTRVFVPSVCVRTKRIESYHSHKKVLSEIALMKAHSDLQLEISGAYATAVLARSRYHAYI